MVRRLSELVSPNPDINENREIAVRLIEKYNKTPHTTTRGDIEWFWDDLDLLMDSESTWEYVSPKIAELSKMYPFAFTEWFEEFYRYMPECLSTGMDGTGEIDWNLFFSLAYPLPKLPYLSFRNMIRKLNVAQNRLVREQIKEEIWNNPELQHKILRGDMIPSIYTHYIQYHTLRKAIIERHKKAQIEMRKQVEKALSNQPRRNELEKLFRKVARLREEGKEVVLNVST